MVTEKQILAALSVIIDPDFQRDIVSLGFVKNLSIDEGRIAFEIELTTPACPLRERFKQQATERVQALEGVTQVDITMTAQKRHRPLAIEESGLKTVRTILAVSSCKGGVGKSTVAALLARTLSARGHAVGLLDADIYGPSIPTLFNLHETGVHANEQKQYLPYIADGVKLMSFGFLAGDGPAVLRGPMVAQYTQQMLHNVHWGELDYLIIDMPPGTGDIQLTISQSVQVDASVIVTTPHQLSLTDVRKGIMMFETVNVPVLGVIENMAYFECDDCHKKHALFGQGGGKTLSERFGLETLAELPVTSALSGSLQALTGSPLADQTTDAVIRALGRKTGEKPETPALDYDATHLTLSWSDGTNARVAHTTLRKACACALCIDEMTQRPLLDPTAIPEDIHPLSIGTIGNYALTIDWSDGHNTGFFPYKTIKKLAQE
jgi:ATP-binding protein involved in chromosome partitioning